MKQLGVVKTNEPIANLSALTTFVECVDELPEANTVPVGSVFQLIDTQKTKVAMHFYMCVEIDGKKTWIDITKDPDVYPSIEGNAVLFKIKVGNVLTGFFFSYEDLDTEHFDEQGSIAVDDVERDVLVGKSCGYPIDPSDGTEMFSSVESEGVTLYPVSASVIGDAEFCFYRLFRIFKSGFTIYVDVDVHDDE